MNGRDWIVHLSQFFEAARRRCHRQWHFETAPPLPLETLVALSSDDGLHIKIPSELVSFWTTCAQSINCFTELDLLNPANQGVVGLSPNDLRLVFMVQILSPEVALENIQEGCSFAFSAEGDPVDAQPPTQWIPFCDLQNGDYVAIAIQNGAQDAPVAYLSHESHEAIVLATSFNQFLDLWRACSFLHPFALHAHLMLNSAPDKDLKLRTLYQRITGLEKGDILNY